MSERYAYFFEPHAGVVQRARVVTWGARQVRLERHVAANNYRSTLDPADVDETPEAAVARYRTRCELILRNAETALDDKRQAVADARALVVEQLTIVDVTR